jgi:hypothetical protein
VTLCVDSVVRNVGFVPPSAGAYDPRHLLQGCASEGGGGFLSGFFDNGSFQARTGGFGGAVVGASRLPTALRSTQERERERERERDALQRRPRRPRCAALLALCLHVVVMR